MLSMATVIFGKLKSYIIINSFYLYRIYFQAFKIRLNLPHEHHLQAKENIRIVKDDFWL